MTQPFERAHHRSLTPAGGTFPSPQSGPRVTGDTTQPAASRPEESGQSRDEFLVVVPVVMRLEPAGGAVTHIVDLCVGNGDRKGLAGLVLRVKQSRLSWLAAGGVAEVPRRRWLKGIRDRVVLVPEVQPFRDVDAARVVSPREQVEVFAQRAAGRHECANSAQRFRRVDAQHVEGGDGALAVRVDDHGADVGPGQQSPQGFGDEFLDALAEVVAAHVGDDVVLQGPDDSQHPAALRCSVQQYREVVPFWRLDVIARAERRGRYRRRRSRMLVQRRPGIPDHQPERTRPRCVVAEYQSGLTEGTGPRYGPRTVDLQRAVDERYVSDWLVTFGQGQHAGRADAPIVGIAPGTEPLQTPFMVRGARLGAHDIDRAGRFRLSLRVVAQVAAEYPQRTTQVLVQDVRIAFGRGGR